MKRIKNILWMIAAFGVVIACERDLESEGITVGLIRYPALQINGDQLIVLRAGVDEFVEEGAVATLGVDDISGQIEMSGEVDDATPGIYEVNYSVTIENELGEESTRSATRTVIVQTDDVKSVDLSGVYVGTGLSFSGEPVTVTKTSDGWYHIDDVLSSTFGISADFVHISGDLIAIPLQPGGFGNLRTTVPGTYATLTPAGFEWKVFIGCCGIFGPVTFVKQ